MQDLDMERLKKGEPSKEEIKNILLEAENSKSFTQLSLI